MIVTLSGVEGWWKCFY